MNAIFCRLVLSGFIACLGVSCTTTYDAYGRPQQTVDPAAAVLGAAAVGLLAYGLASGDDDCDHHSRGHGYGHSHYNRHDRYDGGCDSGGYYRPSCY